MESNDSCLSMKSNWHKKDFDIIFLVCACSMVELTSPPHFLNCIKSFSAIRDPLTSLSRHQVICMEMCTFSGDYLFDLKKNHTIFKQLFFSSSSVASAVAAPQGSIFSRFFLSFFLFLPLALQNMKNMKSRESFRFSCWKTNVRIC